MGKEEISRSKSLCSARERGRVSKFIPSMHNWRVERAATNGPAPSPPVFPEHPRTHFPSPVVSPAPASKKRHPVISMSRFPPSGTPTPRPLYKTVQLLSPPRPQTHQHPRAELGAEFHVALVVPAARAGRGEADVHRKRAGIRHGVRSRRFGLLCRPD